MHPMGISLDFSLAFTCWQPASACNLPEFIDVALHPLWALWEWGCYSRLHPSLWACILTMGLQWWTGAPSCTHLQFWLGLDHTLATAAVSAQITPVFSWVCLLKLEFSTQSLSTPAVMHLGLGSTGWWQGSQGDDTEPLCWFLCFTCCAHLWASEASFLSWLISPLVKELLKVREHFLFIAPSQGTSPVLIPIFAFILSGHMVIFLTFFVFWDPPPAFSRYFVRIIPHVDVFLMYLWDEVSSTSFYSPVLIWPPKLLNTLYQIRSDQISRSVMSDSATPWIAARQASLSITKTCTQILIGSLFIISPKWKQSRCLLVDKWTNKMWSLLQCNIIQPLKGMKY